MASKAYLGAILLAAAFAGAGAIMEPKAFVKCLDRLIPCAPYLQKPELPETCCVALRDMLDNNMPCLCTIYNSPSIITKINMTRELVSQLPLKCGRPVPYCEEPKVNISKMEEPSAAALTSQVNVDIESLEAEGQLKTDNTSGSSMRLINTIFLAGLIFCSTFSTIV